LKTIGDFKEQKKSDTEIADDFADENNRGC
jgi:hypothetical protein